jgi:transcriptional regulator with XRE-family HTH domain
LEQVAPSQHDEDGLRSAAFERAASIGTPGEDLMDQELAPLRQTLIDLLASFRKSAGLTQRELADRLSYARVTVSSAESGHRLPARAFWISADAVLGAAGELVRAYEVLAAARLVEERHRQRTAEIERRSRASVPSLPGRSAVPGLTADGNAAGTAHPSRLAIRTDANVLWESGRTGTATLATPVTVTGDLTGGRCTLTAAPARFFNGSSVKVLVCTAVEEDRILATVPAVAADDPYLWRASRGLLVSLTPRSDGTAAYALDVRTARRRLVRGRTIRLPVPRAYVLDDFALGLIWAVTNLDEALLGDDALLVSHRDRLTGYESFARSAAGRDDADGLSPVSQLWLGSDFCARHILRHVEQLAAAPTFWTREQRGEEASTWLLFTHKYEYLRRLAERFGGAAGLTRAFCIPADQVTASPRFERILLLLAAALMESFGVRVDVTADPAYQGVEGFVLDSQHRAIVASWVGTDSIWYVDVTDQRPALREYADITGAARGHSVTHAASAADRLRAFAGYLELDWTWLTRRAGELGEHGLAGMAEPRSRLMSAAGVDRACHYLGTLDEPTDP